MTQKGLRSEQYAKDARYEHIVECVNGLIENLPRPASSAIVHPIVFIAGLPRSGTSVLYQALASTNLFCYPTNLMARFFARPIVGAMVQELVSPWFARGSMSFQASAGNTKAWYEPHEFGYFWEKHFPFEKHHEPDEATQRCINLAAMAADFAELQEHANGPLLFKNPILSFVNPLLASSFPTSKFVRIRRPELQVAQSILELRRRFHTSEDTWLSIRPRGADESISAYEQIAYQVVRVRAALRKTGDALGANRWLEIDYETFCIEPRKSVATICEFLDLELPPRSLGALPESFEHRDALTLPRHDLETLRSALASAQ